MVSFKTVLALSMIQTRDYVFGIIIRCHKLQAMESLARLRASFGTLFNSGEGDYPSLSVNMAGMPLSNAPQADLVWTLNI